MSSNLAQFRLKIKTYSHSSGHTQTELPNILGLHLAVLSRKLSATQNSYLTNSEVKKIIETLLKWQAIASYSEVIELLDLAGLRANIFSTEEWQSYPLNQLAISEDAETTLSSVSVVTNRATIAIPLNELNKVAAVQASNLPAPLTKLVGRDRESTQVIKWLKKDRARLVTLHGPGGVGKTRLAIAVGNALKDSFADGVYFINLAEATNKDLLMSTIAQFLPLSTPTLPQLSMNEAIRNFLLTKKELLLILDNFEQLAEAAAQISQWLSEAPGLHVLVTSRILLGLYGERHLSVPALNLPNSSTLPAVPTELLNYEAIDLFVERIQDYNPDFQLTKENYLTVVSICELLDGLPLALELAASRLRWLTLEQLLNQLQQHNIKLLGSNSRKDIPPRQQTLSNALEWSYTLLSKKEQLLLQRLSIANLGWTVTAASQVCSDSDNLLAQDAIPDLLENLENHSLLKVQLDQATPLYYFLQTIRQYAFEKLLQNAEESKKIWEKAFQYFRQQIELCKTKNDLSELRLYLKEALSVLFRLPNNTLNQHRQIDLLLERAKIYQSASELHLLRTELESAELLLQQWLAECTEQHNQPEIYANTLSQLAWINFFLGSSHCLEASFEQAFKYFSRSLEQSSKLKDTQLKIKVENVFASMLVLRGYFKQALPLLEQSIDLLAQNKQWRDWIRLKCYLAATLASCEKPERALQELTEANTRAIELQDSNNLALIYLYYAIIDFIARNPVKTLGSSQRCIELLETTNDSLNLLPALALRGWAESELGQFEAAAQTSATIENRLAKAGGKMLGNTTLNTLLAEIKLNSGCYAEAIALCQETLAIAEQIQDLQSLGQCHRICAQALAKFGERASIESHLRQAVAAFELGGATAYLTYLRKIFLFEDKKCEHSIVASIFK